MVRVQQACKCYALVRSCSQDNPNSSGATAAAQDPPEAEVSAASEGSVSSMDMSARVLEGLGMSGTRPCARSPCVTGCTLLPSR